MKTKEKDLIIPSIRIINNRPSIDTTQLIEELQKEIILYPCDKESYKGRHDSIFSQTVRNLISHSNNNEFGKYVIIDRSTKPSTFSISVEGKQLLKFLDEIKFYDFIEEESEYININNIEAYVEKQDIQNANNRLPQELEQSNMRKWKTDKRILKTAVEDKGYNCCYAILINETHQTFLTNNNKYIEGHHLIPMAAQKDFEINLDRTANIIPLCPICHKALHYGSKNEKEKRLKILYNKYNVDIKECGIVLSFQDLINKYYL